MDDDRIQEPAAPDENDALLSRLRLIEERPLGERGEAFGQLYEELRAALEAGDAG